MWKISEVNCNDALWYLIIWGMEYAFLLWKNMEWWKFSSTITGINWMLKYVKMVIFQNSTVFPVYFDQINASVSKRDFFQKPQTFERYCKFI